MKGKPVFRSTIHRARQGALWHWFQEKLKILEENEAIRRALNRIEDQWKRVRRYIRFGLRTLKFFFIGGMLIIGIFAVVLMVYIRFFNGWLGETEINYFLELKPPSTLEILSASGNSLIQLPGIEDRQKKIPEYRKMTSIGEIPLVMRHAVLAAEDKNFFTHHGVDGAAILRAGWQVFSKSIQSSFQAGRVKIVFSQGASTLTQQVVRLVFLKEMHQEEQRGSRIQKLQRKLLEMQIAMALERELAVRYGSIDLAKAKIFEMYTDLSFCGHGRYGISACVEYYFGKAIEDLSPEEAAMIAGVIRNPNRYSPRINAAAALVRRNQVLALMKNLGYLEEKSEVHQLPIKVTELSKEKTMAPAAVNYVIKKLWGGIVWENGAQVSTSITEAYQTAANDAVEYGLNLYRGRFPGNGDDIQAALVAIENENGKVRALFGGNTNKYTSYNRALAKRQPGSAIKPIVYLAAIEQGKSLECADKKYDCKVLDDLVISIPMGEGRGFHTPKNYNGTYLGLIPMWQCFAESRNACTLWLAYKTGLGYVIDVANRLGLYKQKQLYPTVVLGSEVVSLFDLTVAYAVFANGGYRIKPLLIEEVLSADGRVIQPLKKRADMEKAIEPEHAFEMLKALRHAVVWQNGTGTKISNIPQWDNEEQAMKPYLGFEVAGKTGTTNDFKDAWFCGITYGSRGLTVCVWVGKDNNSSLGDPLKCKPRTEDRKYCASGGAIALPIAREFFKTVYAEKPPDPFPERLTQEMLAAHQYGKVLKRK